MPSHVFMVDIPTYPKLLAISDAAINISPDLIAKVQILENAIAADLVMGLSAPVVLSSRANPPAVRLATLALAVFVHGSMPEKYRQTNELEPVSIVHCAAQSDVNCCPNAA